MNSQTKLKISGVDLFFRGRKSSVLKLLNEIKSLFDASKSVTYDVASKVSPIYYDYEHCITIKFGSEIESTNSQTIFWLKYNEVQTNLLIKELKLKNISYLGSELYIPNLDDNSANELNNAA